MWYVRHSGLAVVLLSPGCVVCICRGKLLNVREANAAQISANVEIQNIKQILGLQHGKVRRDHERIS